MTNDPFKYFRIEARELVDEIVKGVLALEKGAPTATTIAGVLRHAHTMKGAARVVQQGQIADDAHAVEELLEPYRASDDRVPGERIDAALALADAIGTRVAALPGPESANTSDPHTALARPDGAAAPRTIRTDVTELDGVLDGVGETNSQLGALRRELLAIERTRDLVDVVVAHFTASAEEERPAIAGLHRNGRAKLAADELRQSIATLGRNVDTGIQRIDRELRQMRDAIERIRLVPADALFTDLERAARDVAQEQGKQVHFEGVGGDLRLDAHVLETVQTALHQIVRNAVAHGIEPESQRRAAGKPAAGRVVLEVVRRGARVAFVCRDDGGGIDLAAVTRVAQEQGLLTDAPDRRGPEELMRLLLRGGLSTSTTVTEISGRGIGLDVVRDAAQRLGGDIRVRTGSGTGTTVEFEVPLSVASFDVITVEAAGTVALIPLEAVERTLIVRADEISVGGDGAVLTVDGAVVPFLPLAAVIADAGAVTDIGRGRDRTIDASAETHSVVIVAADDGAVAAIGVSRLLATSSIVARPLPDLVTASPVVSGAWLDADGTPRLVLAPEGLVAEARRHRQHVSSAAESPRSPILVVDDSLTTRMLEQSILESAGYTVQVATSGEEALTAARRSPYLLFLVDVEMPGMDGFTFVEQTRADSALRNTPAILVSSRSAPEDLQRGFDAGASAYITKGDFDQGVLLDHIRALTVV